MSVSKAGSPTKPSGTAVPSKDTGFERELFQLISQLEQILARLDEVSTAKRLPSSIEIAKELLVELLEFSQPRFKKESLKPIIDQVCEFHEQTKQFERLYKGRTAVERVNARLKIFWGVDDGNVAGARRFHAHVGVVMVVHAALALWLAKQPRWEGSLSAVSVSPIAQALARLDGEFAPDHPPEQERTSA